MHKAETDSENSIVSTASEVFRLAIEQSFNSVVVTDADLDAGGPRIVFCNPAFTTMTGYTRAELLGQSPRILQGPLTDPAVIKDLKQCLRKGQFFHGCTINYKKDGTAYHVEWNISPVRDGHGQITHFISVQQNLTQQIEAQRERDLLAKALNETADPAFILDHDAKIVYCNKAYEHLTGQSLAAIFGRLPPCIEGCQDFSLAPTGSKNQSESHTPDPILTVVPEERTLGTAARLGGSVQAACREKFLEQIRVAQPFQTLIRNTSTDGNVVFFEQKLTPLTLGSAGVSHFVGIVHDVTERTLRERDLAFEVDAQARQIEALSLEDQMAADVHRYISRNNQAVAGISYFSVAPTALSGDCALWQRHEDGRIYLGLLDAMGHGAPAAISTIPVALKFREWAARGEDLGRLVQECNQLLHQMLPVERFVAAIFICLQPQQGILQIWNGGMPEALMLNSAGGRQQAFPSQALPLGILCGPPELYHPLHLPLNADTRFLLMASDGLLEQTDGTGQSFAETGWSERLGPFAEITQHGNIDPMAALCHKFERFRDGVPLADDTTLVQLDLKQLCPES